MSKAKFVQEIAGALDQLSPEAREYFQKYVVAKRVDKKAQEKSVTVKAGIVEFLQANPGKLFTRTQIADHLYQQMTVDVKYLENEKGELAYGSITAYANQLVTAGAIVKAKETTGTGKSRTEVVVYGVTE